MLQYESEDMMNFGSVTSAQQVVESDNLLASSELQDPSDNRTLESATPAECPHLELEGAKHPPTRTSCPAHSPVRNRFLHLFRPSFRVHIDRAEPHPVDFRVCHPLQQKNPVKYALNVL
ncbi:uncharacterized protein LOC124451723 [Xenia sp. Carnegie-2017]|uniref:uncharacterized protein LOC124451723 n=1 Tax=Xenia sp. Carnegie-2017 TaxID=2897299 RepID=UPI001F036686|nr:uncharacterized protein LOC124451723 [Xenia sp. Carnegie-2017]